MEPTKLAKSVRTEIEKNFDANSVKDIVSALEDMLPMLASNAERVQLSVIFLSKGDLKKFFVQVARAKKDWRDVLIGADLASATGWRAVAKTRGVDLE